MTNGIFWAGESSDRETALEAREIRVKFKINFLQRPARKQFWGQEKCCDKNWDLSRTMLSCCTQLEHLLWPENSGQTTQKQIQNGIITGHSGLIIGKAWAKDCKFDWLIIVLVIGRMCWALVDKVTVLWLRLSPRWPAPRQNAELRKRVIVLVNDISIPVLRPVDHNIMIGPHHTTFEYVSAGPPGDLWMGTRR